MISALAVGLPLADNNFGDTQTDGIAGPLGLLIIVLLAVATVLLIRNMNGRIKRLPQQFPGEPGADGSDADKADSGTNAGKESWHSDQVKNESHKD